MPGDGGVARQIQLVRQIVTGVGHQGLEIQDRGDQDDAVDGDAVGLGELVGQGGGARGAVAFADEINRGGPAAVFGEIESDESGDGFDVGGERRGILRPFRRERGGCSRCLRGR